MKLTEATAPPITPLDTAGLETVGSVFVCTVTESVASDLATPMVQPASVTVTAIPATSEVPEAAKTMDVAPGCAGVRMAPDVDDVAVGVAEVAKKPAG